MARKQLAFLTYEFLFDPANTWQHVSQFEGDFAMFLRQHGLEAQFVESVNPKESRRILYIRPIQEPGVMGKEKKPTPPQDVIKKYSDPKTYEGKK